MPGRPGGVKHAPSLDTPGVVWHPFGQAGGITTTPPTLVPHRPERIILVVCPSGEDMLLRLGPRLRMAVRRLGNSWL